MKFSTHAKDLTAALDVVGIVAPAPVKGAVAGFLFTLKDGQCHIYSRDSQHQARVRLEVEGLDEEGSFIFPMDKIGSLKYLEGRVDFESGHDESNDRYWVRYTTESGASAERSSIDPRFMQTALDKALEGDAVEVSYPAALLREGIGTTKHFLAKAGDTRAKDLHKILQLFDTSQEKWAAGNGHLFAADQVRSCYFFCEAFEGKRFSIHADHLGKITTFLSKCQGDVTIRTSASASFMINSDGQVLGWTHNVHQHEKFTYYPYSWDGFILRTDKDYLLNALRYVRAGLDAKEDKIRVVYSAKDKQVSFLTSETSGKDQSMPVMVESLTPELAPKDESDDADFGINVNVNHLIDIIEPMKSNRIDLRVAAIPSASSGRRQAYLFRTIDTFKLDSKGKTVISAEDSEKAYECRVTRVVPSRD